MTTPQQPYQRDARIETIQLQVERVAAQYAIPRQALTLSVVEDHLFEGVVLRLVRMVAVLPGAESLRLPATWWDGLKLAEQHRSPMMRWWLRRHPVQWRVWRALEHIPNIPELDRYRGPGPRIARWVQS